MKEYTCLCVIVSLIVLGLTIGSYCFSYDMEIMFGKEVSLGWSLLGGVCLGTLAIPSAAIVFVIHESGVPAPFFGK